VSRSQDDQLTAAQQRQLQQFLGRQQQFALRVQQQNERQTSALTPKFRPSLCRKSLEMSAQHFKVLHPCILSSCHPVILSCMPNTALLS
jgi:hypothetical protein